MESLARFKSQHACSLTGLLFDLDDTLLEGSRLTVEALQALFALRASGLALLGVTGRPASWGSVLLAQWPLTAMVTENGSARFWRDHAGRVQLCDRLTPARRQARRNRLLALAEQLQRQIPELLPSADAAERSTDHTLDIGEHRCVAPERVAEALERARHLGLNAVRSSIHLHLSLDADDKASGTLHLLQSRLGQDPTRARELFGFVGDSDNDAPLFAAFRHTFAVSNLRGRFSRPPRYRSSQPRSAGFVEIANRIVELRPAAPERPSLWAHSPRR